MFTFKSKAKKLKLVCNNCDKSNLFDQPYAYHAGFSDQGFLYDDTGHMTFVWSWFDPVFKDLFPDNTRWTEDELEQKRFESMLLEAPSGGKWRFKNPARCLHCREPILGPMLDMIYYIVYPNSVITDKGKLKLSEYLKYQDLKYK